VATASASRPSRADSAISDNATVAASNGGTTASLHAVGGHTIRELEELFSITRSTVYRALARDRTRAVS
jgi:hypothetical protein